MRYSAGADGEAPEMFVGWGDLRWRLQCPLYRRTSHPPSLAVGACVGESGVRPAQPARGDCGDLPVARVAGVRVSRDSQAATRRWAGHPLLAGRLSGPGSRSAPLMSWSTGVRGLTAGLRWRASPLQGFFAAAFCLRAPGPTRAVSSAASTTRLSSWRPAESIGRRGCGWVAIPTSPRPGFGFDRVGGV